MILAMSTAPPPMPGPTMTPALPPRTPDPGSSRMSKVAWVLMLVLTACTVGVNQSELFVPPPEKAETVEITPPGMDEFSLAAKAIVKVAYSPFIQSADERVQLLGNVEGSARHPVDKFRAAIVTWDLSGPADAEKALDRLSKKLSKDKKESPQLVADIHLLRAVMADGPGSLSPEEREGLTERHGWFGKLALSHGAKKSDPERAALIKGGAKIVLAVLAGCIVAVGAFVAGCVFCVLAIVRLVQGRFRPAFVPPAPGGSIFIETLAVFVFVFLVVMKLGFTVLASVVKEPPAWFETAALAAQWSMVIVPLYPLLRGVPFGDLRQRIGWHSGKGVWTEIGAGLAAYLAGLPLLGVAFGVTLILVLLYQVILTASGHPDAGPPPNRIVEVMTSVSGLQLFLLFTLATIWAPLVEESLFRGALYRTLRSRWGIVASAVVSALFFGLMHGYAFFMLLPVITLGFVFALTREWRGGLIGPMVAHGLHNGNVLTLALVVVAAIKD